MCNKQTIAHADLAAAIPLSSVRRQTLRGSAAARGSDFP
jgi:hypothetical protein